MTLAFIGIGANLGDARLASTKFQLRLGLARHPSPAYRTIPALLLLVVVMYVRPQGLLGRR